MNRGARIGMVGLGRLGMKHAENLAVRVGGARLEAVCALEPDRVDAGAPGLGRAPRVRAVRGPAGRPGAGRDFHRLQLRRALPPDRAPRWMPGFTSSAKSRWAFPWRSAATAERAVARHPDRVFMLGFMRRYDPSYRRAKEMIDRRVTSARPSSSAATRWIPSPPSRAPSASPPPRAGSSWTCRCTTSTLRAGCSGGEATTIFAAGRLLRAPGVRRVRTTVTTSPPSSRFDTGAMAFFLAGRTAAHGYEVETEIIGTKGTLRIASGSPEGPRGDPGLRAGWCASARRASWSASSRRTSPRRRSSWTASGRGASPR